jgi:hypothetical protein
VVCVPATGLNPTVPHDTWSGLEITLKGTAHDPDGDATLATYEWDFGDGSPVQTGAVTNPYAIEAKHTYVGSIGNLFVATLRVTDTSGDSGSDQYLVQIRDGTDTDVQVNLAIDEGLWYLHKQQIRGTYGDGTDYGYWSAGQWSASNTGASTEAFEIQGSLPDGDVNEDPYVDTVQRGLNYLLANTHVHNVPVQTYGNPDSNGNSKGLGSYTDSYRTMYEVGITLMALASSQSPDRIAETGDATWVKGRKYSDIVQDMVDYLAWGQNEGSGCNRGGWRYHGNQGSSDNSCSQWPVIGMEAAEANFGSTIPSFVRSELQLWLNESQNTDGGFSYSCSGSSNIARTGAGVAMMTFVGIPTTDPSFQSALNYLDTHWTTTASGWDSHYLYGGNYYAFYGVMKGARLPHPDLAMIGSRDWYVDYANFITGDQEAYGGWLAWYGNHNPYLSTAWAILTLKKTVVQPGPVADAGPDVPSHPPVVEITFDGTGSFHRDPSRNIVQYIWDFGDGSPLVEGAVVTHAFPAVYLPDGTIDWTATTQDYTVTLTVVDDNDPSLTDSDTTVVHITPPPYPPVADANGPYSIRPCEPVPLDGSSSYDPNGALYPDPSHPWHGFIVSWEWDLDNDGEYDDASGETVTWPVCDLGVHVVGLKVTNNFGASDEVDTVVNVGAIHDVAVDSVTPSAHEVLVGTVVDIDVGVSNLGDYVESFGVAVYYDSVKIGESVVSDLSLGGSQTVSFSWDTTGLPEVCYTIKAVADTIPGEINTINNIGYSELVCITYNQPPTADPNGPYHGYEGSPVDFDGTGSFDPDGDPLTYDWDWGDGSPVSLDAGPTPSHIYDDNGTYDVCLTVTDPFGLSDTSCTSTSPKPMDVIFALDSSGSMGWNDPSGLRKTASKSFVDKMDSLQDTAGVVSWDGDVDFTYGLSDDFPTVKSWIDLVDSSGGTNLDVGLNASIGRLDSGKQPGASWVIIMLSNGEGTYSGGPTADAASKGYVIYSIGLGSNPATGPLMDMANSTGGQYYSAPTADNLQAIFDDIYVVLSQVVIENVAPIATFNAPSPVDEGDDINLSLTGPSDPSIADTLAGFEYAFDCGDGSGYGAWSSTNSATCPTDDNGMRDVKGKIRDKDEGVTEYIATVVINNVAPTATFNAPTYVIAGNIFDLSLTDPYDPSPVDTAAGFEYDFDCGGGYDGWGAGNIAICNTPSDEVSARTVKGKIRDKDGGETEYTATVYILPPSAVTDSSLCYFDREPNIDGLQFRLIFTPDMKLWPAYKLPASNPGQFFYNVFYTGANPANFSITVPEPFETQGAMPVHVYTEVSVDENNCFVPDAISEIYAGDQFDLSGLSSPSGFFYVAVHLDYGLKGTTGYIPNYDNDALNATDEVSVLIPNLADHTFSVSGSQSNSQTVQNSNEFKKIPGFGGLVLDGANPVPDVAVVITHGDGTDLGTTTTDKDGWYMLVYKHKGKMAEFTVSLPAYDGQSKSVTLKANKFAEVNFVIE